MQNFKKRRSSGLCRAIFHFENRLFLETKPHGSNPIQLLGADVVASTFVSDRAGADRRGPPGDRDFAGGFLMFGGNRGEKKK